MLLLDTHQQDPLWVYPVVLGGVGIIVGIFWLVGRILNHFFPNRKKFTHAGGNALMRIEPIFQPSRQHVVEMHDHEQLEEGDEGDPPDTEGR